ncbi:fluoride efflux transporter FluC [Ornithinibacillus sp. 179-J 7C1 HS]|uniref:fluoride efflux transporter FluC n=1 Tax=Ornithinibacillus sp. 179-J 7C1 HS TaxID=3142384 RepID=UPI0039A20C60
MNILLISVGGFIGSILRFYISRILNKRLISTWIANITGSFLLAITVYLYANGVIYERLWAILGIGFCGAYTTFSTFGNEVIQSLLHRNYKEAVVYVTTSIITATLVVLITFFLLGYKF